jgi:NAD(P)H dehydrogenase (quinone)
MTDDEHRYLVTGATGRQGGAVARRLAALGRPVYGLSRSGDEVGPGIHPVRADLAARDEVFRAFHGITHAAVTMPLVYDLETVITYAVNVAEAARAAGVRKLVFNTNTRLPAQPTPYAAYETRRAAETALRASGLPVVILRPTVYLDNLFSPWAGPALVNEGVLAYPLPADLGVAWVSHSDLAASVVAAMELDGLSGRTIAIGGPQAVTGPELAQAFADVLGREVVYRAVGVEEFESGLATVVGPDAAAGVSGVYRWAQAGLTPDLFGAHPSNVHRLLGTYPTPLTEWIAAQPWWQWSAHPAPGR